MPGNRPWTCAPSGCSSSTAQELTSYRSLYRPDGPSTRDLTGRGCEVSDTSKLKVVICGNTAPDARPEDIPSQYLGDDAVQEAVLWVASEFPAREALYDRYEAISAEIDNLLRVGALREEDGKVFLNFTLFTRDDHRIIHEVSSRYADQLAIGILARRHQLEDALLQLRYNRANMQKAAMFGVGCLCLDAGGLQALERSGHIVQDKQQTGGRFTVSAEEILDLDLRGIYWGCHSDAGAGLSFVSFGDHASRGRNALPDILWWKPFWVQGQADPAVHRPLARGYLDVLRNDLVKVVKQIARDPQGSIEGTACSPAILTDWLRSLGYLDAGGLAVPYFGAEDIRVVRTIKDIVLEQVTAWCDANYADFKTSMSGATPVRHGVDFKEVFIQIWHWVFGLTNKRLAEAGFMFDTYGPGHKSPGCVPAIVEDEIWQALRQ